MKRTCDELGVCQGCGCSSCDALAVKRTGDIYPLPILADIDQVMPSSVKDDFFIASIVVAGCISVVSVIGTAGYLYARYFA